MQNLKCKIERIRLCETPFYKFYQLLQSQAKRDVEINPRPFLRTELTNYFVFVLAPAADEAAGFVAVVLAFVAVFVLVTTTFELAFVLAAVFALAFAGGAGRAPLNSLGLLTTCFAKRLSIFASSIAIAV